MLKIRCKSCNTELETQNKIQVCGCQNMTSIIGNKITAEDLTQVIMVNSHTEPQKSSRLTSEDMQFQESRIAIKVRKLDFEVR